MHYNNKKESGMGRLIVDGNQVYEIDEDCLKRKTLPRECGVWKEMEKMSEKQESERIPNYRKNFPVK
jgi:hypothetical protein